MSNRFLDQVSRVPAIFLTVLGLLAFLPDGSAQTNYQRIHSFGPTDIAGTTPRGALIEGSDGFLYGTTYQGGTNDFGTVYKVRKDGTGFALIRHFDAAVYFPNSGVIEASNGVLYGCVPAGGANNAGVLYKLNKDGSAWSVVRSFAGAPSDGNSPEGGLLQASDGLLYGTTAGGGATNLGTLYRINPNGTGYSVLFSFSGTNGSLPSAAVIEGPDGWLYGTTKTGGSADAGTVFKIQKSGAGHTVLRHFLGQAQSDGAQPLAPLAQGADGFLYGTTYAGGAAASLGTVFKVNTNGTGYQVIYVCQNTGANGWQPLSKLTFSPDNRLYGTFPRGGSGNGGVAFRMNTNGSEFTVLHSFTSVGGDGITPYAPLLLASDGAFYGSTFYAGDYALNGANGILFRLFSAEPQVRIVKIEAKPAVVTLNFVGGAAGQAYSIQSRTNLLLGNWLTIGSATANIDGTFSFPDPAGATVPARFYRSSKP